VSSEKTEIKVWCLWNCPKDCKDWNRPYSCNKYFNALKFECPMRKRNIQPFVIVDKDNNLITNELADFDVSLLDMRSKTEDWQQYLKPCSVYQNVKIIKSLKEAKL